MTDRPAFTLALFSLLLAVVFTIAFWTGRALGPDPVHADPVSPVSPHSQGGHG